MFHKLSRELWPESVQRPYARLFAGLAVAPLIVVLVLAALLYVLNTVGDESAGGAMQKTLGAAQGLMVGVYGFTFTFGLAAVLGLWALRARSITMWCLSGGVAGLAASLLNRAFSNQGGVVEVASLVAAGMAILLITRGVAGVRAP